HTSPSSGTPNRRGTSGACAWPSTTPSTGRRSIGPSLWGSPGSRGASARAASPGAFGAGEFFCARASVIAEPIINYLNAVGIRAKLRPIERAAFFRGDAERKYRGLLQGGGGGS